MVEKKKVAIACQGGGSQTAFTAGVLKSIFKNDVHKKKEIVSLSGSSGGAVCAALSWYSLLKAARGDKAPIEQRLDGFWRSNSTQNVMEETLNDSLIGFLQFVEIGMMPEWKIGPDSPMGKAMLSGLRAMFPRFYDFKRLLEAHMDFEEIKNLVASSSPVLLLGAANVLTGEFKKFSSLKNEIRVEAVLASAAVPSISPAVQIEKDAYWDGLLSDNPPTNELIDRDFVGAHRKPDELWVIQINPEKCGEIPKTPEQILDRRNEMIGNQSLFQDLKHIEMVNRFLKEGAFTEEYIKKHNYKHVDIFIIRMSEELLESLPHSSKLNRHAAFIDRLKKDGERQGTLFLQNPGAMIRKG